MENKQPQLHELRNFVVFKKVRQHLQSLVVSKLSAARWLYTSTSGPSASHSRTINDELCQ